MSLELTAHVIERYVERVRPDLDYKTAQMAIHEDIATAKKKHLRRLRNGAPQNYLPTRLGTLFVVRGARTVVTCVRTSEFRRTLRID
jgi:hypothetical protein